MRFDEHGIVEELQTPGGTRIRFDHREYVDGPLVQPPASPGAPRGPPLRVIEATGAPDAVSGSATPSVTIRMTITNLSNRRSAQLVDDGGRHVLVVR
jgi:hypothetical protein